MAEQKLIDSLSTNLHSGVSYNSGPMQGQYTSNMQDLSEHAIHANILNLTLNPDREDVKKLH